MQKPHIDPISFLEVIAANIDNDNLAVEDLIEMIRNTLPAVDIPSQRQLYEKSIRGGFHA